MAILKWVRKTFYTNHCSPSPKLAQLGGTGRKILVSACPLREKEKNGICSVFLLLGGLPEGLPQVAYLTLTTNGE